MTLLDALMHLVNEKRQSIPGARIAHFAFSDDGASSAYVSEMPDEELLEKVETWCEEQRVILAANEGRVH